MYDVIDGTLKDISVIDFYMVWWKGVLSPLAASILAVSSNLTTLVFTMSSIRRSSVVFSNTFKAD